MPGTITNKSLQRHQNFMRKGKKMEIPEKSDNNIIQIIQRNKDFTNKKIMDLNSGGYQM